MLPKREPCLVRVTNPEPAAALHQGCCCLLGSGNKSLSSSTGLPGPGASCCRPCLWPSWHPAWCCRGALLLSDSS